MATIEKLNEWGERLVLAMMASADTEVIRPKDWWTRAQTALEKAAWSSEHYTELLAVMARKLQIPVLREGSTIALAELGVEIGGSSSFEEFRQHLTDAASIIVSMAIVKRRDERAKSNQTTSTEVK